MRQNRPLIHKKPSPSQWQMMKPQHHIFLRRIIQYQPMLVAVFWNMPQSVQSQRPAESSGAFYPPARRQTQTRLRQARASPIKSPSAESARCPKPQLCQESRPHAKKTPTHQGFYCLAKNTAPSPATRKIGAPIFAGVLSTFNKTGRPTINSASSAGLVASVRRCPTISPARIIDTLSVIAIISANLWVISKIVTPSSRKTRRILNNCSVSCGVKTPVGSSRIKISAPPFKAL